MFCNVAGTANDVIYNSADSAALNLPLWVGFMPKRLLPYHTKQVISDNGQLQNQFVCLKFAGRQALYIQVGLDFTVVLLTLAVSTI